MARTTWIGSPLLEERKRHGCGQVVHAWSPC
jgi:hypothetical protein